MAESLRKQLQVLAAFQATQQAWDSQMELLHATRADSPNCKQQLLQLHTAGQGLLDAADSLEVGCSVPQGFCEEAIFTCLLCKKSPPVAGFGPICN